VHQGGRVGGGGGSQHGRGGHGREVEVVDPLEAAHGPAPRDEDVAAAQRGDALVGGDGDVPHPVGLPAPRLRQQVRQRQQQERLGHGERRRGVDELGDGVAPGRRGARAGQQVRVAEQARAGVRRPLLLVEPIVGGLRELAVGDEVRSQVEVQRVQ